MSTKTIATTSAHEAFRKDFVEALRKASPELTMPEMIALMSVAIGQMIAMLDQRKYTPERALELVLNNIELGNRDALDRLITAPGGHA